MPRAGEDCCRGVSGERKAKGGKPGKCFGVVGQVWDSGKRVVEEVTLVRVFPVCVRHGPWSPHGEGEGAVRVGMIKCDESSWMRLKLNWPRIRNAKAGDPPARNYPGE